MPGVGCTFGNSAPGSTGPVTIVEPGAGVEKTGVGVPSSRVRSPTGSMPASGAVPASGIAVGAPSRAARAGGGAVRRSWPAAGLANIPRARPIPPKSARRM